MGQAATISTACCGYGQQPWVDEGEECEPKADDEVVGEARRANIFPRLLGATALAAAVDKAGDVEAAGGEPSGSAKTLPRLLGSAAAAAAAAEPEAAKAPAVSPAPAAPMQLEPEADDPRFSDPSHPAYVPLVLRHGPREKRHLRHLGLIKDEGFSGSAGGGPALAEGDTAPMPAAPAAPAAAQPEGPAEPSTPERPPAPEPREVPDPRFSDPSHPDYVPMTLRHGPREIRHMEHLGLIKASGSSASVGSAPAAGSGGTSSAVLAEVSQRQKTAAAAARVKDFLSSHGFSNVNDRRRQHIRAACPLHVAVRGKDAAMVRLLLRAEADPRGEDSFGRTPLRLAQKLDAEGSHAAVVAALESGGVRSALSSQYRRAGSSSSN